MTLRTPRFGASNRKLARKAIDSKNKRYECPKCGKHSVKREGNSIWTCQAKSCGAQFAGGTYALRTEVGEIVARTINEYDSSS
ncbi:MAG: 50S ribosomal protein L37ae [Candidatus Micrarchaeota archaeon]